MRLILTATVALGLAACATMEKDDKMMDRNVSKACAPQTMAVFFDTDSADFDSEASAKLNTIAAAYKGCDLYRIEVDGYADSVGDSGYNLELSDKRANSVVGALSVRGVSADRIRIVPMGERTADDTGADAYERRAVVRLIP